MTLDELIPPVYCVVARHGKHGSILACIETVLTEERTMAELKSCPFCGRKPKIEECGANEYFVKCSCGIEQTRLYGLKCDAARHWNRRKESED